MTRLIDAALSIPEAAYVTGVTERTINHEIDASILRSQDRTQRRAIGGADVVYLGAVRGIRKHLAPPLRRQMREAIASAIKQRRPIAKIAAFELKIAAIEREIQANLITLKRMKRDYIESRPEVLAGEPVIKGTRIPARLVADLIKSGTPQALIQQEYDLTPQQTEATVIFDRVTPKRGRPPARKSRVRKHVLAHR